MMPKPAETKGKTNTYFPGRTATFEPSSYSSAYNLYDDVLASVAAQTAHRWQECSSSQEETIHALDKKQTQVAFMLVCIA